MRDSRIRSSSRRPNRKPATRRITVAVVMVMFVTLAALACSPSRTERPTALATPTPIAGTLGSLAYGVDGDTYVAEWDGSNAVRIADGRPADDCGGLGEYWGKGPIWSPDGRYLAYRHVNCEDPPWGGETLSAWWDVVISDREGNVVASFPSSGWRISWSPDSTRVAVWVTYGETIGVYGVDGVRQALLTVPPGMRLPWRRLASDYSDPIWSPDGESLVVPDGVEIPLDGSTPRKLPWADELRGSETYSPDGSRVAYNTTGGRSLLIVAEADGSHAQEVTLPRFHPIERTVRAGSPVWSPTGDRIAFRSSVSLSSGDEHGPFKPYQRLHVLDLATGTVTLLTEVGPQEMGLSPIDFSPEGDRILFSRGYDPAGDATSSLWSINADGSDPRRLVAGTAWGDWLSPSRTPTDATVPSQAASGEGVPDPTSDDGEVVQGWPDTSRNPAGVYSWDGSRCAGSYCAMGFMHNGYGSGDVEIRIEGGPGGPITDDSATAVTVAGYDGFYRRIDARREEWIVDIEGTTIAIRLEARPGTSQADLADAHAIIESMRTEPQDSDLGFRLVFTLTTNDWDSG